MTYRVVPFSMTLNNTESSFKARNYSTLSNSQTLQDSHMVTTDHLHKVI